MTRAFALAAALPLAWALAACSPTDMTETAPAAEVLAPTPAERTDAALAAVLADPARSAASKDRDRYRHPAEALAFWGLKPGMTVLEVGPGAGWWTEILAPYAASTNGKYVATAADPTDPEIGPERAARSRKTFADRVTDARFGTINYVDFGPTVGIKAPPGGADLVLIARAFHNWAQAPGMTDRMLTGAFAALKPGGVLAVEQHRAPAGSTQAPTTGYVTERYVIEAAEKAGFRLDAKSEVNANANDDRDHPFGVWTLQPVKTSSQNGKTLTPDERAQFDAIGESDRMTLRFVKPA